MKRSSEKPASSGILDSTDAKEAAKEFLECLAEWKRVADQQTGKSAALRRWDQTYILTTTHVHASSGAFFRICYADGGSMEISRFDTEPMRSENASHQTVSSRSGFPDKDAHTLRDWLLELHTSPPAEKDNKGFLSSIARSFGRMILNASSL